LFDAHAHLDELPANPHPLGIRGWIVPGVDVAAARQAAEWVAADGRIVAALGLHPWYLPAGREALETVLAELEETARAWALAGRPAVAIGETGLDAGRRGRALDADVQREAFRAQLRLAARLGLPLVVHCVRAHGACVELIEKEGFSGGGMVHDFGGARETVAPWVAAGFALSISPRALGRGARFEETVRAIPGDCLLVETDDAGTERLPAVVAWLARVRGEAVSELAARTEESARRLVGSRLAT
jgi:TatD DNase family protein